MRQWRVGTFSMGILLIMVGVLLMLSEFMNISSVEIVFKWWPVILIILGIEILTYLYTSKEEMPRVKYDGFSIFVIILVLFVTMGVYCVKFIMENHEVLRHII